NATVTYKNGTGSAVTINDIVIAGRPPAGTNSGGPYADLSPESGLVTVAAGATVTLSASRTFTSSDPTGTWYAFATYQDSALVWHDGPNVNFTVSTTTTTTSTPPVVSAGSNQTITLPASATLNGTASGSGTVTTAWSKFSGPGTVTFGNANALSTTASFSTSGSYMLQLTGTNAYGTSSSTVTITVNPTGTGTTSTPVVNAGGDQTITLPATASLSGTATGFPSGSILTQTWSKFGGTGTVTFSSTTSLATVATF